VVAGYAFADPLYALRLCPTGKTPPILKSLSSPFASVFASATGELPELDQELQIEKAGLEW
jgi:hypothetical protein